MGATNTELSDLKLQLSKSKKGTRLYNKLLAEIEALILLELIQSDATVSFSFRENKKLLVNQGVKFKVYREGGSYFGTHATRLNGTMHKNGFVYLEATKMMLAFIPFSKSMYPVCFQGQINWDGKIGLNVSKRNFQLFGSQVPEEFVGDIDEHGNVKIKMVESSFEFSGDFYIHKLIFDPFKGDESKRLKFIENTISIKKKINESLDSYK